ncbi:MAG TPA: RHS repeat-associated core domain-containing protein, partial [Candidatus Angelobacter sp.]
SEQRTIAGIQKSLAYTYNLDSSVATLTYPSGAVVSYMPDAAGRIVSAIDPGNNISYVTGATYGPDSGLTGFVSGRSSAFNGITNSFSYNNRLQPTNMSATAPNATVFSVGYDFHLGNGDNGNVFAITNYRDQTRNQSFAYDSLNRLISAQNAGTDCTKNTVNGKTEYWGNSYSYDAWGNLLQKTVTKCSAENLSVSALANNQLVGYTYDAAGNMQHDATSGFNYSYDQENRITSAAGYTYAYDSDGNRVEKSNGSTGTIYWPMSPGIVAESDLSGNLKSEYVFFGGKRVARKDLPGGAISYYFNDNLGTASVITDSAGNIKADSDYYPWGGELQFANGDPNHYKFGGHERDGETGLDYMLARYYSNPLGRFLTPDWAAKPITVPYANFGNPQSLNLYTFGKNNPRTFGDPDGHFTDYYSPEGKKLGSDGINNGAVAITKYGVDKMSDGTVNGLTTCAVGCTTIEKSTGVAIQASVDRTEKPAGGDTKGNFHEEGFTQDKNGTIHNAQPGPVSRPGDTEAHVTQTVTSNTAIEEHTHPAGTKDAAGTTTLGGRTFRPEPSPPDIKGAGNTPAIGQQITHIEASAGDRTVYFYDDKGVYAHVPLSAFPEK